MREAFLLNGITTGDASGRNVSAVSAHFAEPVLTFRGTRARVLRDHQGLSKVWQM
jgi:hypothetical protein